MTTATTAKATPEQHTSTPWVASYDKQKNRYDLTGNQPRISARSNNDLNNRNGIRRAETMKAITKQAERVFRPLMKLAAAEGGHLKLNNKPGLYMALCVERVGVIDYCGATYPLWSFAHYGEQNGDAMRDPDVIMMDGDELGLYPISSRQDYLGLDADSLIYNEIGRATGCKSHLQADIAAFCNAWAKNINEQQNLIH